MKPPKAIQAPKAAEAAPERNVRDQTSGSPATHRVPPGVRRVVGSGGAPLSDEMRSFMEPRFGHSFADVRIHHGSAAARSAADIGALAYTVGKNVVFGRGQYRPGTTVGQRLLAHELTHVVQQRRRGARATVSPLQRKATVSGPADRSELEADRVADQVLGARGERGSEQPGVRPAPAPQVRIVEDVDEADISRLVDPASLQSSDQEGTADDDEIHTEPLQTAPGTADADAPELPPEDPSPSQNAAPAPDAGSLSLTPATLTRGDTLTARFSFSTSSGTAFNVTNWSYTAGTDTVTRPTTDATFQSEWSGIMVLSGTLSVSYTVTPAGGGAPTTEVLTEPVTVADRTGAPWLSTPTLNAPGRFTGQPSPPRVFSHLGIHRGRVTNASATSTTLAAGPNSGFSYTSALTAGTYASSPAIHPDVTTTTSRFYRFHQDPSRLYLVRAGTRTLIPLADYNSLTSTAGSLSFSVPDWEAFYKTHNFYTVTATAGGNTVAVQDGWWELASNAQGADVQIKSTAAVDAALRAALGIGSTAGYSLSWAGAGWEGFELLPSATIDAGTRGHEYGWGTHSHRANFVKILRALDPQRRIESTVGTPSSAVNASSLLRQWSSDLQTDDGHGGHRLVDEAASRASGTFEVIAGSEMHGVNQDETTGNLLGTVWNIHGDQVMSN